MRGDGLDRSGSGLVQVAGSCECGNIPWGILNNVSWLIFKETLLAH